jgi:hypothetical protein
MSEHARERSEQIQYCRSRRVTTTADLERAMCEQRTTQSCERRTSRARRAEER